MIAQERLPSRLRTLTRPLAGRRSIHRRVNGISYIFRLLTHSSGARPPLAGPGGRLVWLATLAAGLVGNLACAQTADEPWRLQSHTGAADWLSVSGHHQLRYEWLDNTFRPIDAGTDELLVSRVMLTAEARIGSALRLGAELQDSRAWGAGTGTPLGTDDVNALEPLQLYVGLRGDRWLPEGDRLDLRLGRFTMAMGRGRLFARHIYRNTLQAFTGAQAAWSRREGPRLQAFVVRPVRREPSDRSGLEDNDVELDGNFSTLFWGVHVDRLELGFARAQAYLLGIDDSDEPARPTRNRNFVTAGLRLLGAEGEWSWEIESAVQAGSIRETTLPTDTADLDHRAWLLHATLRRRFRGPWNPVVELRYDYASGDRRPGDGDNETFDTLFGPIRFDYGPTGIYNALRRNNSNTPGLYLTVKPQADVTWMTGYRAAWLASRRDRFGNTQLRDPDGNSGNFIGHQLETRVRWDILPGNLQFEAGGAVLFKGRFLETAPGTPSNGDTIYLYSQLLTTF